MQHMKFGHNGRISDDFYLHEKLYHINDVFRAIEHGLNTKFKCNWYINHHMSQMFVYVNGSTEAASTFKLKSGVYHRFSLPVKYHLMVST